MSGTSCMESPQQRKIISGSSFQNPIMIDGVHERNTVGNIETFRSYIEKPVKIQINILVSTNNHRSPAIIITWFGDSDTVTV